jgi:hypothetical protein
MLIANLVIWGKTELPKTSNVASRGKVKRSDIVASELDPLPDGRTKTAHDFGSTMVDMPIIAHLQLQLQ